MPDLKPFIDLIKAGELVAFPTETVYGLGADAWNPTAIQKVFSTKGRPADNPLIVHISNPDDVADFAVDIPEQAALLMDAFWPGPLTLVLNKKPEVLDLVTGGLNTVAIRMPDHSLALDFISQTGPLVAPSANKSGRPSPTKAAHVQADFGPNFPVIDGGETQVGLESTVLDLSSATPTILRPGSIGKTELEKVLGNEIQVDSTQSHEKTPKSPGQKYSHYKPSASVYYGEISSISPSALYLVQDDKIKSARNIINYKGNLQLLSKELYDRFRYADIEGYSAVYIESLLPYQSDFPALYDALLNRINKAVSN